MNFQKVLRTVSVLLSVFLFAFGLLFVNLSFFGGKAACLTVAAAMPDGVFCYLSNIFRDNPDVPSSETPEPAVEVSADTPKDVNEIPDFVGNIVKKTIAPYSSGDKYGPVCMSNQCGEEVDIAELLKKPLDFTAEKDTEPQVLIYHTHATESYILNDTGYYTESDGPRTTDESANVIAVGDRIAAELESAGYSVIHDKTLHDYPGYTGCYARSGETVAAILSQYPSIKVAIDVHRDSISSGDTDRVAPVVDVGGKKAAQVMLVMGSETGTVENYPEWRQNLSFALRLQYVFETSYPQFARALLLRTAKYNQNLCTGSILIEVGSDANTLEEALYSGELVGKALAVFFDSQ